jgi:DNA helicase-2/ATP-dependent DNA helicase PcrA
MTKNFTSSIKDGYIRYEDIAPMMYLKLMLGYTKDFRDIKHLIIDEVQDYSYMEMLVFFTLYEKVQMTLLGDANQAINHITDSNDLKESVAGDYYRVKLEKSYRSTMQIASFCNKLIDNKMNYEYVDRSGPEPIISKSDDLTADITGIINKTSANNSSIAIITKTYNAAERLFMSMEDENIQIIRKSDSNFRRGVVITPSYLAKGLEFDAVIVVSTGSEPFEGLANKKLFYTCCSRALHELYILYEENPPYETNSF